MTGCAWSDLAREPTLDNRVCVATRHPASPGVSEHHPDPALNHRQDHTVKAPEAEGAEGVPATATKAVSRAGSVSPAGTVQVKGGASIVCSITLANGAGGCTLTAKRLIPGTYHLVAVYLGNGNYLPSASAAKTLTVVG